MARQNKDFAKLISPDSIEFAPLPLLIEISHKGESTDPETGETVPYEWTERKIKVHPSEEDFKAAGYLPLEDNPPSSTHEEGYHYEPVRYDVVDGKVVRLYALVEDALPTLDEYDAAMEEHLLAERSARGYTTREPDSYLTSEEPRWCQDAKDWVAHRDDVMRYALGLINAVQSGQMTPPKMEEFKAGLPEIEWHYTDKEM